MQVSAEKERPHGRIVVGVDGSASSMAALRWALDQAEATGAEVAAVYAWKYPMSFGSPIPLLPGVDIAAEAGTALAAAIAKTTTGESDVTVRRLVVIGDPATVLLRESEHAELLVVGDRGRDEVARAMLGSVSQRCVHHAACPVVVVRG
jgi:nucleotide-binding universal stress UspA family protein